MNCTVKVRYYGGAYVARAGRGRNACMASSTDRETIAVQRAAAKFFGFVGAPDTWESMALQVVSKAQPVTYTVTVGVEIGGAS